MILTEAEIEVWTPPPCLRCGATPRVDWVDISELGRPCREFVNGHSPCPTPGCADDNGNKDVPLHRCRSCRREPGDVHGPDCGPLMFAKLERPHIITVEDCR